MEEYVKLAKKLNLPSFEEMNSYFQIADIEDKNILHEVVKKIHDQTTHFTNMLEEIINPEHLRSLNEAGMFSEEDKKIILRLYRKLQHTNRQKDLLEVEFEEEAYINFINNSFNEYKLIKDDLKGIIKKLRDCWNKNKNTKLELGYFG